MRATTMAEFEQTLKASEVNVLDVREADEFANGHIEGAQSLPLSILADNLAELNKETAYHVICLAGGRSARACEILDKAGFEVTNVLGGMSAWRGETVGE